MLTGGNTMLPIKERIKFIQEGCCRKQVPKLSSTKPAKKFLVLSFVKCS